MNIQTLEKFLKQLHEAIARFAGQPYFMDERMQECRQYCPIKTEQPVQHQEKRSDYYR